MIDITARKQLEAELARRELPLRPSQKRQAMTC
jgi:hypothetical protein